MKIDMEQNQKTLKIEKKTQKFWILYYVYINCIVI